MNNLSSTASFIQSGKSADLHSRKRKRNNKFKYFATPISSSELTVQSSTNSLFLHHSYGLKPKRFDPSTPHNFLRYETQATSLRVRKSNSSRLLRRIGETHSIIYTTRLLNLQLVDCFGLSIDNATENVREKQRE